MRRAAWVLASSPPEEPGDGQGCHGTVCEGGRAGPVRHRRDRGVRGSAAADLDQRHGGGGMSAPQRGHSVVVGGRVKRVAWIPSAPCDYPDCLRYAPVGPDGNYCNLHDKDRRREDEEAA